MANWFVAFPVNLDSWLDELEVPFCVRKFMREDVHLTIAFLGNMNPLAADVVIQSMQAIRSHPFSITLGKLIALPSRKYFSAISLELGLGSQTVAELVGGNRDALYTVADALPDLRPPLPHLTIARPRRNISQRDRESIFDWMQTVEPPSGEYLIDRVALYTYAEDRTLNQFRIVAEERLIKQHE